MTSVIRGTRRIDRPEQRERIGWALLLLAVAARVAWAAWIAHSHPLAVTSGDTADYLGPARAIAHHGHFYLSPTDSTPMFLRPPGYPIFLSAILKLTDSVWAISPIQAGATVFIVVLTVLIGRRMIGPTAGLVAGAIVVLDPLQFALSGSILSESLSSFMLLAVVAASIPVFTRERDQVRVHHLLVLGALLGAATLVRPTTYYFPAIVVVLLVVHFWRLPRRSVLALVLAFVLPIAVLVGGWQVRNHREIGTWQIAGTQAVTLYCYHAADVESRVAGTNIHQQRIELGCHPGGWDNFTKFCPSFFSCDSNPLADGNGWDEMAAKGMRTLIEHPVQTAEVMVAGLARGVFGPGTDTVSRFFHADSSPALVAVLFLWNLALWSLAAVGAVVGLRSPRRMFWVFVLSAIAYVMLASAGAETGARFRAPVIPLLAILAASGVKWLVAKIRETMPRAAVGGTGAAG